MAATATEPLRHVSVDMELRQLQTKENDGPLVSSISVQAGTHACWLTNAFMNTELNLLYTTHLSILYSNHARSAAARPESQPFSQQIHYSLGTAACTILLCMQETFITFLVTVTMCLVRYFSKHACMSNVHVQ